MFKYCIAILICLCARILADAQPKNLEAHKTSQAIRIDGSLDELVWQKAPAAKEFITNTPEYGKPSSSRTDVDYFAVFLDTYRDRQNAFQFQVTSRNVQSDARVSPQAQTDFGVYGDLSWDAVWDSRVSFKSDGWVVEMKIPYFSIRFSIGGCVENKFIQPSAENG